MKEKSLGQESSKENLSAKEELTQVNPCREYERKTSRSREFARKPLGQGRIHPSESLPRVRKKISRPREFARKPLGQGRIHPSESLSRVRKKNLSAKEEFIQVNPCREYEGKTSQPREFARKPLGQESSKENISAKEEFTQVNPCQEYERKTSRPREFARKPLSLRRLTKIRLYVTFKPTHSSLGAYVLLDGRKADQTTKPTRRQDSKLNT